MINQSHHNIKLINSKPEIYNAIVEKFPAVSWEGGIIITYNNAIYTKSPHISDDLWIHELTHISQQAEYPGGYRLWWAEYMINKEFRFSQEVEAYKNQWEFLKKTIKDRNKLFRYRHQICSDLSSQIYGGICSYSIANRIIM